MNSLAIEFVKCTNLAQVPFLFVPESKQQELLNRLLSNIICTFDRLHIVQICMIHVLWTNYSCEYCCLKKFCRPEIVSLNSLRQPQTYIRYHYTVDTTSDYYINTFVPIYTNNTYTPTIPINQTHTAYSRMTSYSTLKAFYELLQSIGIDTQYQFITQFDSEHVYHIIDNIITKNYKKILPICYMYHTYTEYESCIDICTMCSHTQCDLLQDILSDDICTKFDELMNYHITLSHMLDFLSEYKEVLMIGQLSECNFDKIRFKPAPSIKLGRESL